MTRQEFRRLVADTRKSIFPNKILFPIILFVKRDDFFMATAAIPIFPILLVDREVFKMNDDAITGCLLHELCHMAYPWRSERRIDQTVINIGYGRHLYEFYKYHDHKYERYTKKDGLTKKEILKQLNKKK